jgi:hypothetical protein
MVATVTKQPLDVCLMADHLDAMLAAGEDLLALELRPPAEAGAAAPAELAAFVRMLLRLEESIIARLLQARRRAPALSEGDPSVAAVLRIFLAQTGAIEDIVAAFGQRQTSSRLLGTNSIECLRIRGLIGEEAAGLAVESPLKIDESFRLAGVVALGPLLDLVAATVDALDVAFGLYPEGSVVAEEASVEIRT